jgi:hypothetical protein
MATSEMETPKVDALAGSTMTLTVSFLPPSKSTRDKSGVLDRAKT